MNHPLTQAAAHLGGADKPTRGIARIASACGVTYQAAKKWVDTGRLPRTEWTGETNHAERIVVLLQAEGSPITRDDLMCRKVGADTTAPAREVA